MLRAAAKNFKSVTVVPSPEFYNEVLSEIENEGQVTEETRRRLALAAFRRTAEYDAAISEWLGGAEDDLFPERRIVRYEKASPCVTARTRIRRRRTTRKRGGAPALRGGEAAGA
jgi:phosphoribosylaminoimidazolecarboxamide formyltransferase/IMP cyclohydrolase